MKMASVCMFNVNYPLLVTLGSILVSNSKTSSQELDVLVWDLTLLKMLGFIGFLKVFRCLNNVVIFGKKKSVE